MVPGEGGVSFDLDTGVLETGVSGADVLVAYASGEGDFDAIVSGVAFGLDAFVVSASAVGVFGARVSGAGTLGVSAIGVGAELLAIDPRSGAGGALASA